MKKKLGTSLLLMTLWVLAFPVMTYAGGTGAAVCVEYFTLSSNGYYDGFDSRPYTLSQTVQGPDGSGKTSRWYENNCFHYEIATGQEILHPAGVYKLTKIDYPAGYELDTVAVKLYPLSITITQAQLDEYLAWSSEDDSAGTKEFEIKVPIKRIGTISPLLSKPQTPKIYDQSKYGSLYISANDARKLVYQVQYSTKKDSGYKTLYSSEENNVNFEKYNALKEGKTYYFRARVYRKVGDIKVYSSYSKPLKAKVSKAWYIADSKPQIKAVLKNGKTSYIACGTYSSDRSVITATFYYSEKKAGPYKVLATQNAAKSTLKNLTKLKAGKTWYVKMRWSIKLQDGTVVNSKTSNILTVKR